MVAWAALAPIALRTTDLAHRGWIASRLVHDRCPAPGPDPRLAELHSGLLALAQRERPAAPVCPSLTCPGSDHLSVWQGILIYLSGLITGILLAAIVLSITFGLQWPTLSTSATPIAEPTSPPLSRNRKVGGGTPWLSARAISDFNDDIAAPSTPTRSTASTNVGSVGDRLLLAQLAASETRR